MRRNVSAVPTLPPVSDSYLPSRMIAPRKYIVCLALARRVLGCGWSGQGRPPVPCSVRNWEKQWLGPTSRAFREVGSRKVARRIGGFVRFSLLSSLSSSLDQFSP